MNDTSLNINPLNESQKKALGELMKNSTREQIIWLSGYFEGSRAALAGHTDPAVSVNQTKPVARLTIIYGSETGHSQGLAKKLAEKARNKNVAVKITDMYDYKPGNLQNEDNLAIIVSTHGEGEPPDMAEDFYKYVISEDAARCEELSFSVLALGDKTYRNFCKTGEEIDKSLRGKGAYCITPLVKCDVDYEITAEIWMNNLLLNLTPLSEDEPSEEVMQDSVVQDSAPEPEVSQVSSLSEFSKKNPYMATILDKTLLTRAGSDKEVYHLELSIEASGITYEPGDSIGIFAKNPDSLVEQILQITGFNPDQKVFFNDIKYTLSQLLTHHLEITVITFETIQKYFDVTQNLQIEKLLKDEQLLDNYLYGHDLLDLLEDFPYEWKPSQLIDILRPLPPRLYSIASSQDYVGDEVHVTVSVVRYERKNRLRYGACSSHLADIIEIDDQIPVYIEKNPAFKLPLNGSKMIMVGAGTGIAPYRAFIQHRESHKMKGNTWLFFGDRRFDSDFLYQEEWQDFLKNEYLAKMTVAFSRDQKEKVYVQHKLLENQKEIYRWIEDGAIFYLCGDMKYMAKDVNEALLEIISTQQGVNRKEAEQYLKKLKREKRYQIDVY